MNWLRKLLNLFHRNRVVVPIQFPQEETVEVQVNPSPLCGVVKEALAVLAEPPESCCKVSHLINYIRRVCYTRYYTPVDYRRTYGMLRLQMRHFPELRLVTSLDQHSYIVKGEIKQDYQI